MADKKIIILLFLLSMLPSLIYSNFVFKSPVLHDDGLEYHGCAVSMLEGKGFQAYGLKTHRSPGYPFFLMGIYFLFGQSVRLVIFLQCMLIATSTVLVYLAVLKFSDRKTALAAYLITTLSFGMFSMPAEIVSEPLFTLLLFLSYIFLQENDTLTGICLSGVFAGCATLTRPLTLMLPLFILIFLAIKHGITSQNGYVRFAVFLVAFVGIIVPWSIRNYAISNNFILINTQLGEVLWGAHNPLVKGDWININSVFSDKVNEYKSLSEYDKNAMYTLEAIAYIKHMSFAELVRLCVLKLCGLFYLFYPWYDISFGFILPFFFYGLWLATMRKRKELLLPCLFVGYLLFTTLIFYGSPRFRGPFYPFIAILAGAGFSDFYLRMRKPIIFIGVWASINVAILLCAQQLRDVALQIKNSL